VTILGPFPFTLLSNERCHQDVCINIGWSDAAWCRIFRSGDVAGAAP
jgi:hypothetical protein